MSGPGDDESNIMSILSPPKLQSARSASSFQTHSNFLPSIVTTEQLALVGFAARLKTTFNRPPPEAENVREEAELLMCLSSPRRRKDPSPSLLYNENFTEQQSSRNPKGTSSDGFFFRCPSLSLEALPNDSTVVKKSPASLPSSSSASRPLAAETTPPLTDSDRSASLVSSDSEGDDEAASWNPARLFERTLSARHRDSVSSTSSEMANHAIRSFEVAMGWRAKSWMQSIAKVIALKEKQRLANKEYSQYHDDDSSSDSDHEEPTTLAQLYPKEATVISALLQVFADVYVSSISTNLRMVSRSPRASKDVIKKQHAIGQDTYKIEHNLAFEATLTVSLANGGADPMTIILQAPGKIEGTFVNPSKVEGAELLTGVEVTIDTNVLASCIERQSRLMVRKASEAFVVIANENQQFYREHADTLWLSHPEGNHWLTYNEEQCSDTDDYTENGLTEEQEEVNNDYYPSTPSKQRSLYEYGSSTAVVTPRYGSPPHDQHYGEGLGMSMPPPAPRLLTEDDISLTRPMKKRRISPLHLTPSGKIFGSQSPEALQPPSIVSPPPSRSSSESSTLFVEDCHLGNDLLARGPSLPILLSVAAAMCEAK